mmetsp:Transcript_143251/g.399349  ORF Transcript_143251/g.399349 Transcript_143251/m.399349 type:complete len:311 (+) Transcript_143251:86-1018(+)|eukprot:CAMPEP_0179073054 /NCGR_PEP_ID=MMETSP0796-20121207/32373_1 /TAXON_ID=73915 /ORGANISM="Pyrodinium bahamense, Strain pbaha01" /LENGTH=310 /DNA_ID=CAMNT_0020770235 /DNA_START=21 /DNA_END=953 /DNA_ORIENTATION=+
MGYTIYAGCDTGSDVWQTAVHLSALRGALEAKSGHQAVQTDVVCCASVSAPAGSPLVKVVQTAQDGSLKEVVAGGEANKFYSVSEIISQLGSSEGVEGTAMASTPAKAPAADDAGAGSPMLASGKDYVIVLSNTDPWAAAVETAGLRRRIQEATGGALPAVVTKASAPTAVVVTAAPAGSTQEGETLCSGATVAEVEAALCGPLAAPVPAAAAPKVAAPKVAAPLEVPAAALAPVAAQKQASCEAPITPATPAMPAPPPTPAKQEPPASEAAAASAPVVHPAGGKGLLARWLSGLARFVCRLPPPDPSDE